MSTDDVPQDESSKRSPMRIVLIVVAALVAVVALAYGAIFFYANVINDSPDELDESDLADALDRPRRRHPGAATPRSARAAPSDTDPRGSHGHRQRPIAAAEAGYDGDWVPTDASEFGYRVEEVLAGVNTTAVGRSNEISGLMTIAGTTIPVVDIEVQVASITSDESRRDGAFTGRIMSADEFPTATFNLTQPIELGAVPADGEQITASATGNLTSAASRTR